MARARLAALLLCAVAAMSVLAGCRQLDSLSRQEVVVVFKTGATQADHARVYAACQGLDGIEPEPMVTDSKYPATLEFNVRYRVDGASNYQLQKLYDCLAKYPSIVAGYKPPGDMAH
jgi:hypothetical protein